MRNIPQLTENNQNPIYLNEFRDARNALKRNINHTKKTFYRRLLSWKKQKEVWKLIQRILNLKQLDCES